MSVGWTLPNNHSHSAEWDKQQIPRFVYSVMKPGRQMAGPTEEQWFTNTANGESDKQS